MGLDMYLNGVHADGTEYELAYWRKHPDLHGFLVQAFACGIDDCEPIPLTVEQLTLALVMTVRNELPKTTGLFFGTSELEDHIHTIEVLNRAINWLSYDPHRKVYYQASW